MPTPKPNAVATACAKSLEDFERDYMPPRSSYARYAPSNAPSGEPGKPYEISLCTAKTLPCRDLIACLKLIEKTSGRHYRESRQGWNVGRKWNEMGLWDLKYLVVREGGSCHGTGEGGMGDGEGGRGGEGEWGMGDGEGGRDGEGEWGMGDGEGGRDGEGEWGDGEGEWGDGEGGRDGEGEWGDGEGGRDGEGEWGDGEGEWGDGEGGRDGEGEWGDGEWGRDGEGDAEEEKESIVEDREGEGAVKGFMSFMPTFEDGIMVLYLYEIHLVDELRGTGLGTHLMSLLASIAHAIPGVQKTMLTCFTANEAALSFYSKLGYLKDEYSPEPKMLKGGRVVESGFVILSRRVDRKDEGEGGGEGKGKRGDGKGRGSEEMGREGEEA